MDLDRKGQIVLYQRADSTSDGLLQAILTRNSDGAASDGGTSRGRIAGRRRTIDGCGLL